MNSQASVSVRLNPFKGMAGPDGRQVPWNSCGRILDERPQFTLDPLLHAGCYYVQDSSAMFVGHIFRKNLRYDGRPLRVLDLCAAPGGKTTDLAASLRELAGDDFSLTANEVMRERSRVLADNVARWGDPRVAVTSVDPAALAKLAGWFDVIVADVPCSGEGMFRKDAGAREQFGEDTVQLCAARQKRILADIWPALREGGLLVYSTCTYQDAENDCNLEWAATELGGEITSPDNSFSEYGVETTKFGNLLRSGVVPGEGQWVGALIKKGGSTRTVSEKDAACIIDGFHPLIPTGGIKGMMKGGKFVPDADYALSLAYGNEFPTMDVDRKTALKFLHRDTLFLPDAPRGYLLIAFDGHPLGFVNNLGTRCNNMLPAARRILMDIQ